MALHVGCVLLGVMTGPLKQAFPEALLLVSVPTGNDGDYLEQAPCAKPLFQMVPMAPVDLFTPPVPL